MGFWMDLGVLVSLCTTSSSYTPAPLRLFCAIFHVGVISCLLLERPCVRLPRCDVTIPHSPQLSSHWSGSQVAVVPRRAPQKRRLMGSAVSVPSAVKDLLQPSRDFSFVPLCCCFFLMNHLWLERSYWTRLERVNLSVCMSIHTSPSSIPVCAFHWNYYFMLFYTLWTICVYIYYIYKYILF